jgi:hypothetical protein
VRGPEPAPHTVRIRAGADLFEALDQPSTRELLISHCADEPGAHRVLGVAPALGRNFQTSEQHRAAYTAAAYAALALGRRELGIGLLDTALEADNVLDDEDPFAVSLSLAIHLYEANTAHYGYFAARLALRLRRARPPPPTPTIPTRSGVSTPRATPTIPATTPSNTPTCAWPRTLPTASPPSRSRASSPAPTLRRRQVRT